MNIAICWMSPPRKHSIRPRNVHIRAIDVRLTWLYRCSQEERDLSLLNGTIYSSRICGNVGTQQPITFGTRASFGRTFRHAGFVGMEFAEF